MNVLTAHFCHTEDDRTALYRLLADITEKGSDFRVLYSKKESASATVCVYVSVSDDYKYVPTITVTDREGNILLQKRQEPLLNRENFENQYGALLVNKTRVLIRPRKNEQARGMKEIILPIGEG